MARRRNDPPISGVLLIDKPSGLTSHDVVSRARRALGVRRIGHAGTLDPMATGVLVLGVGPTTRLLGIVGGHDKEYTATIRLGAATTTDDREGAVLTRAPSGALAEVSSAAIVDVVGGFVGDIRQRPSAVSAVKVDGKRAYQRVREGEDVDLPERDVRIAALDVIDIQRAAEFVDVVVRVECSAGTYVRALARDIGQVLGVGGHLTALRRTRSGAVKVADCIGVEDMSHSALRPAAWLARQEFPCIEVDAAAAAAARNGQRLALPESATALRGVIGPGDDLVAVVETDGSYRAVFPSLNS